MGHHVLRGDEIDIMNMADILQFEIPLRQFLGRQVEPIPLMGDVVVLAKCTSQITPGEEDGTTTVMALYARLLAKVRRNNVHLDILSDQTHARSLIAVDAAESRAEIAIPQVRIC